MKIAVPGPVSESYHSLRKVVLLLLLFSLVVSACDMPAATPIPTATATAIATATVEATPTMAGPVIESGGPCKANVGEKLPLVVSGISDAGFTYRWAATSGRVEPEEGPVVNYVPSEPGAVIIRVEAEKDGVISVATINCTITGPTLTPEVPTPVPSPTPSPTPWECVSVRQEKLHSADIPGQITIDTLLQGSTNVQSRINLQVGGAHTGIPEGKYLWVFIYSPIAGLHGRYYPQGKDALQSWQPEPTTGTDGRWAADVSFGAPNECYEVIVMLAEREASQAIADQLLSWAKLNHFTGYELNGPVTAVPPDAPGFPDGLVEKVSIEVKTR